MSETPSIPDDDAVREALRGVEDLEAGMNIVDLGLVYGIEVDAEQGVLVDITMTTAACPMAEMIVDQARMRFARLRQMKCLSRSGWYGIHPGRRTR
ncbi:MAG: iron-sulfur cluster assembly protein [Burkholderiaceae bacterium]